jgi:hypothetical protein
MACSAPIDIKSLQNKLLKVCYVPATSASLIRLLFFTAAINSTNEANKEGCMCCKAVYILRCLWAPPTLFKFSRTQAKYTV